jgi:DNA repair exonuclease SbcCD ATPase subunit
MFGPRTTPEAVGDILNDRRRLENAASEIMRLQRELDAANKEGDGLREMNRVLSIAFRSSGHSALNQELEQLREALNEERMRSVEARAEVIRYDREENERKSAYEQRLHELQQSVSEGVLEELDEARKTISGLRARIDDLEEQLLKERQSVTRASAIVNSRQESKLVESQRLRIQELEEKLKQRDAKIQDLGTLLTSLQAALATDTKGNATLNFLRSV